MANPAYGREFLQRLTGDLAIGGESRSVQELVEKVLGRDDQGEVNVTPAARAQAAKALVESLDALDKHRGARTPDQQAAWTQATTQLTEIITNTPGDAEAIADALNTYQKDQATKPKEERADFLTLFNRAGSDFNVQLNADQLAALKQALNRVAPGMGDLMVGLVARANEFGAPGQERTVSNALEDGFNAMHWGQNSMARFHGREQRENSLTGEKEKFNLWNGPGKPEAWEEFFSEEGIHGGEKYKFYNDDAHPMTQSFEGMILSKWEDDEIIKFDTPKDRQAFIDHSKQLVMSGEVKNGAEYAEKVIEYAKDPSHDMALNLASDAIVQAVPVSAANGLRSTFSVAAAGAPASAPTPALAPQATQFDLQSVADVGTAMSFNLDDGGAATTNLNGAAVNTFELADTFDLYQLEIVDTDGNGIPEISYTIVENDIDAAKLKGDFGAADSIELQEVTHQGTDTVVGYKIAGTDLFLGADALENRAAEFTETMKQSREANHNPQAVAAQDPGFTLPTNG